MSPAERVISPAMAPSADDTPALITTLPPSPESPCPTAISTPPPRPRVAVPEVMDTGADEPSLASPLGWVSQWCVVKALRFGRTSACACARKPNLEASNAPLLSEPAVTRAIRPLIGCCRVALGEG